MCIWHYDQVIVLTTVVLTRAKAINHDLRIE